MAFSSTETIVSLAIPKKLKPSVRLLRISGVIFLHVSVYLAVNLINNARPATHLWNFHTPIDNWIPYLSWTWTIYYAADVYILCGAAAILWKLDDERFARASWAFGGMIISGGALQLLFPAQAPWPAQLSAPQQVVHSFSLPFACLPSMHVALTTLPSCIALAVWRSRVFKMSLVFMTLLVTLSTVTMKEHYFLDAVAGLLLASFFYSYWRGHFAHLRMIFFRDH